MKSEDKIIREMIKTANALPEFKRAAFYWALCHWNLMEILCAEETPLSDKEFEREVQKAFDTQDYVYYAFLIYLKVIAKNDIQT